MHEPARLKAVFRPSRIAACAGAWGVVAGGMAAFVVGCVPGGENPALDVQVPDVVSVPFTEARSRLDTIGLVQTVAFETTSDVAGTVLRQSPAAGDTVLVGSPIALVLAAADSVHSPFESSVPLALPNLLGIASDEASRRLSRLGLDVRVEYVEEVRVDHVVVRQEPAAEQAVVRGQPVRLWATARELASDEPGPRGGDSAFVASPTWRTVPEATSMSVAQAKAVIEGRQFAANVLYVPSNEPPGSIVNQFPEPGIPLAPGSIVSLMVSHGDADGDGVPDGADECLGTQDSGSPADDFGCSPDQFADRTPAGTYAFNAPDTMVLSRPYQIVLRLEPTVDVDHGQIRSRVVGSVQKHTSRDDDLGVDSIVVVVREFSRLMEAVLTGPASWDVVSRVSGTLEISQSEATEWRWDVVPRECRRGRLSMSPSCGEETLTLNVYAISAGAEGRRAWPVIDEPIVVRLTAAQVVSHFAAGIWPWLGALLLIPVGALALNVGQRGRVRILFLAANPQGTSRLQLDEEVRAIDQSLQKAKFRDRFELQQQWAVRFDELDEFLLRYKPQIVHFSGHGSPAGALMMVRESNSRTFAAAVTGESTTKNPATDKPTVDEPSAAALARLFGALGGTVRCVVLNACYSEIQARAIAQHVDVVIGMSDAIGDEAAITFSTGFYRALSNGMNVQSALDAGCSKIDLQGLAEGEKPRLHTREGVEASSVTFVNPSRSLFSQSG